VHVTAAGFSVALLLPAAHVELDGGDLAALGGGALLRVAAAGAWHNVATGLAAWAPLALGAPPRLFLGYTLSLSFALALLNMAPVHWLDGQAALEAALLRRGRPRRELPERGDDGEGHPTTPTGGSGDGAAATALRWVLHAGTALYAAVLLLHLARGR
jgi:S2P endopeptidase